MNVIDWILNVVCVLLWLNWRAARIAVMAPGPVMSLAASLKRAEPRPTKRWRLLAGLGALLGLRSLFYWQVGSALHWTAALRLGVIAPPFRSDLAGRMFLYSALSFLVALGVFYSWLLLVLVVNRRLPESDPVHRLVRQQVGRVARWPWWIQLLLPAAVAALGWRALCGPLARMGLLAAAPAGALWQQSLVVGAASYLTWKLVVIGLLAAFALDSYVYFGRAPFWNYASATGGRLLAPLRRLPLRIGRADLAPALAGVVVWLAAGYAVRGLGRLYEHPPF